MVVFSMKNERKYNNKNTKKSLLPSFPVNNCENRLISNGFCGAEYIGFCTSLSLIRCKSLYSSGVLYLEKDFQIKNKEKTNIYFIIS
jgi:hypothetical protein